MKGRIYNFSIDSHQKQYITLEIAGNFIEQYEKLKDSELSIDIRKHKERRSLDANAYFHVLVRKIATEQGVSDEEIKKYLVCEYGTYKRDKNKNIVALKLPADVDIDEIYPYTKFYKETNENGRSYKCYIVLEQTHKLNSKEMASLIDGAVYEAQELGIDTDTPEQIALYKEGWKGE